MHYCKPFNLLEGEPIRLDDKPAEPYGSQSGMVATSHNCTKRVKDSSTALDLLEAEMFAHWHSLSGQMAPVAAAARRPQGGCLRAAAEVCLQVS